MVVVLWIQGASHTTGAFLLEVVRRTGLGWEVRPCPAQARVHLQRGHWTSNEQQEHKASEVILGTGAGRPAPLGQQSDGQQCRVGGCPGIWPPEDLLWLWSSHIVEKIRVRREVSNRHKSVHAIRRVTLDPPLSLLPACEEFAPHRPQIWKGTFEHFSCVKWNSNDDISAEKNKQTPQRIFYPFCESLGIDAKNTAAGKVIGSIWIPPSLVHWHPHKEHNRSIKILYKNTNQNSAGGSTRGPTNRPLWRGVGGGVSLRFIIPSSRWTQFFALGPIPGRPGPSPRNCTR